MERLKKCLTPKLSWPPHASEINAWGRTQRNPVKSIHCGMHMENPTESPRSSSNKSKKRHIHHPPQRFARCFRLCKMQCWIHTSSSSSIQCFAEFGRKAHNWRLLHRFCCWKFRIRSKKMAFVRQLPKRPHLHGWAGTYCNSPCSREQAMNPWSKNTFENPIHSVLGAEDDWSERCGGKGDATAKHWCLLLQKAASCQLGACF